MKFEGVFDDTVPDGVIELVEDESVFSQSFSDFQRRAYKNAVEKGFYEKPKDIGTCIALMHCELSEAMEAIRIGNPPDDKVPEFNSAVVEFADCIIRIMDTCHHEGWDLAGALEAKHRYNLTRPYKHGKAF